MENKISSNRNGIYFNINLLTDNTIEQIYNFINNKLDNNKPSESPKIKYDVYNKYTHIEDFINFHKLTNQEKSLIKKYNQK